MNDYYMIIDSDQLDLSTTYTELNNTQCCHSKFIRAALRRYITHTLQAMHPSMDTHKFVDFTLLQYISS